jgi:hypothetical protein
MVVLRCEFVSDWRLAVELPDAGVLVPVFPAAGFLQKPEKLLGELSF